MCMSVYVGVSKWMSPSCASFRWIQNCDIIYRIRCIPCTLEFLPKLFLTINDFKQVIHCTETWLDRIMPGSYPLTSNILCLPVSLGRSLIYMPAVHISSYIFFQPTKTLERLRSWAWAHCLLAIGVSIFSSTRRTPCRGKSWSQISGALVQQQKPVCSTFSRELLRIYFSTVLFFIRTFRKFWPLVEQICLENLEPTSLIESSWGFLDTIWLLWVFRRTHQRTMFLSTPPFSVSQNIYP